MLHLWEALAVGSFRMLPIRPQDIHNKLYASRFWIETSLVRRWGGFLTAAAEVKRRHACGPTPNASLIGKPAKEYSVHSVNLYTFSSVIVAQWFIHYCSCLHEHGFRLAPDKDFRVPGDQDEAQTSPPLLSAANSMSISAYGRDSLRITWATTMVSVEVRA